MKKMMFTLIALLLMAAQASSMSYERARQEALFLTDKMAYELNLTNAQYEACYEINLDYLMGVTSRYDVFGTYWDRRNLDLQYILYSWQWEAFRAATYFYRPLYWDAGYWHFGVYTRYPRRDYFYFGRPHFYGSYRGGHSWRMNGDRSFYEHHRDHFRPAVNPDHHRGMRDGWNRGDYRSGGYAGSSTRVTGGNHGHEGHRGNGHSGAGYQNRNNNGSDSYRPVDAKGNNGSWRSGNDGRTGNENRPAENQRQQGGTATNGGGYTGGSSTMNRGNDSYRPANSQGRMGSTSSTRSVGSASTRSFSGSAPQRSTSFGSMPSASSAPQRSTSVGSAPQRSTSVSSAPRGGSSSAPARSGSSGGGRMGGRSR